MAVAKLVGEIELDGRKARFEARALQTEFNNLGRNIQRSGNSVEGFVKKMVGARSASDFLAKSIRSLGSSLLGGVIGGATIGSLVNALKGANEESNKLSETLEKAVGTSAADNIQGTTQKIESLTAAIKETQNAIGKQGVLNAVAAFFFNEDADRAAKAFEKAVEARIAAGDKLIQQTAEQNAQSRILSGLEGELAEVYKINLAFRKELADIEAMTGLTSQQKGRLKILAEEARVQKVVAILNKKQKEDEKKASEESKKTAETEAKAILQFTEKLIQDENAAFQKNAEDFIKLQQEKKKAAEDTAKSLAESSRRAASKIEEQDKNAQRQSQRGAEGAQFLLQGRAGEQALSVARKRQQIETTRENFRLREATLADLAKKASAEEGITITKQDIRKRLAAQQAAAEMPNMAQRVMAEEAGISPEIIARGVSAKRVSGGRANEGFEGVFESLKKSIDDLSKKIPSAVPQ